MHHHDSQIFCLYSEKSTDKIIYIDFSFEHNQMLFFYMSRIMRKPAFCIFENKDADQLRGDREADQRLCFRYIDSTIPLLSKSEISNL